ncbi:MAG TPA: cysteine desulfurase [Patescibacteria group bacterium]
MDIAKIRKDFPILKRKINGKRLVYLDNAATSQKPIQVINAISNYYKNYNSNVHRGIHSLAMEATQSYDGTRAKIAKFIGVKDPKEIIFVRNTDEAINLVARSLGNRVIRKGDEILVTIMEHHANFVPWQQLAKEKGAKLKIAPINKEGEIDIVEFKKLLSKKTKFVAFTHVSNVLGTVNDVKRLSTIVHRQSSDAKVLVDGAQAVPHLPFDISKIGCDFYAFSAHKMLGPSGIGVLWGKRELLEVMEPYQLGGDMISKVEIKKSTWAEIPYKFEAGTPNIEGVIGFSAAIDYLNKIGMTNVRKHEIELAKYAFGKLSKIPNLRILGPKDPNKRCGVIAFVLNVGLNGTLRAIPPHDVASIMDSLGIEIRSGYNCVQPLMDSLSIGPIARASFYIYNTEEEIDKFADGLKKVREIFQFNSKVKSQNSKTQLKSQKFNNFKF